jgi:dolichyl-phosphate beta-glucosyltransferase
LLLIPAYNEERRIEPVLRDYAQFFGTHYSGKFQLVVVLNGCTDNTLGVVQRVAAEFPAVFGRWNSRSRLARAARSSKASSSRRGDLIGYVDADGATPPHAFLDLVRHMAARIASSARAGCRIRSFISRRRAPPVRQPGVSHHRATAVLAEHPRHAMRREGDEARGRGKNSFEFLRIADMAFDINLLVAIKRAGFRIREVPTEWTDKAGSKVTLFRSSLTMFLSVVRIRLIYSPFYKWLRPLRPLEGWVYKNCARRSRCRDRIRKSEDRWKMENWRPVLTSLPSSIFHPPSSLFPFTPQVNHAQTRNSSRLNAPSVCSTTSSRPGKWFSITGSVKP